MSWNTTKAVWAAALLAAGMAQAQSVEIVLPNGYATLGGSNNNNVPWGNTGAGHRYQQVYGNWEFAALSGPHRLVEIRFRPNQTSTYDPWSNTFTLDLRFSTTQRGPDQLVATFADNTGPNEAVVYSGLCTISTAQSGPTGGPPTAFDIVIPLQTPFMYDPQAGHLLMDVRREGTTLPGNRFLDAQTTTGDSISRAYAADVSALTATNISTPGLITQFVFEPLGPACYANCDGSTVVPILNVDDFTCFINEFAQAQSLTHEQQVSHYSNCDGSTTAPVLNVDDFTCFINAFAAGCP